MSIKNLKDFKWINEPKEWDLREGKLKVLTDNETDFWQSTWYGFQKHTGHVFGCNIDEDFTFQVCIEANFTTLYDQAGIMVLIDEMHWIKAGIEYNDGQPMIGSVLTNEYSDWATGIFNADPKKSWMRITKINNALRLQYSCDGNNWPLLRLCSFVGDNVTLAVMCCTPQRAGSNVLFSDFRVTKPLSKDLHDLS